MTSPVTVTFKRTVELARSLYTTALAKAGFLAAVAVLFSLGLSDAEGTRIKLVSVWALSVSPLLPVLAALLAMDVWSEERRSGRIDVLLSSPVRERDYVLGKFFGVWVQLFLMIGFSLSVTVLALWYFSPEALSGFSPAHAVASLLALTIQGALWSAVSTMISAFFRSSAAALCTSLAATVVFPRGGWAALMAWSRHGRTVFGEMPLDAHVLDFSAGGISTFTLVAYSLPTLTALFITSKFIASLRLSGRGHLKERLSTAVVILLSLIFTALALTFSAKVDSTFELPAGNLTTEFSPRTRNILANAEGSITVTLFMPRSSPEFREAGRFLRSFRRESESVGGIKLVLRYVDPRWDFGEAERLVRLGVVEDSLVFEKGSRSVVLPVRSGYGERICASTVRRLALSTWRRRIYWTVGHGENSFSAYGAFGMSDIARDISIEGYLNREIDLAKEEVVPNDCAMIVVAGAKNDFARIELDRIDAYLRGGGRMLVLFNSGSLTSGVGPLLPQWGMRPVDQPLADAKTLSGSDVVVSGFSDHAVSASLKSQRIILERPVSFVPSAAAAAAVGADGIGFKMLAEVPPWAVAAAVERGAGVGGDTAIRPTRIIAVGDAGFVMNSQLSARANANRDFFLNCVAYLSGAEPAGAADTESDMLRTGLDRESMFTLAVWLALVLPIVVFALMACVVAARRRA